MLKNYLNYLKSKSKKLSKQYNIFDIVLYGSVVRGKERPRDVDLLLVFKERALKERANIAHKVKKILAEKISGLDVKTINLWELFNESFLARRSVITEGYSLLQNIPFSKRLGFKSWALFTYNLRNLDNNEKTKFTYALIGRNTEGMMKKLGVKRLGSGVLVVPIKNSSEFEEFLKNWKVNYEKEEVLMSI